MRELAVDFGTSNTVAAVRSAGSAPRLLAVDGWPVLPSAVWLAPDGSLVVGRDAQRQARLDPAGFEPNPKRRIDEVEVLLGDSVVAVVDLVAAVLRRERGEAERELGGPPDRLVLTHPAGWGSVRGGTLEAAARRAGFAGEVTLIPEPVAAAAHFVGLPGQSLRPGQALAVYDLGGGTVDTAVLALTPAGWRILAQAGLDDLGGRDVDQLLLDHVGAVVGADRPEWLALRRPTGAAARRAAQAVADDVRAAKESLSRYPHADVPLPEPLPDVHVTRAELETMVRPRLAETVALLASTISRAGVQPDQLAGVYLVGGGSRMPLVAQMIAERLGILPVAVESPECSVALGALAAAPAARVAQPVSPQPVSPQPVRAEPVRAGPPAGRTAPRRRGLAVVLSAIGFAVVVAGVAFALGARVDGGSAGPAQMSTTAAASPTAGGLQPPEAVAVAAAMKEAAFGADTELRQFAGAAVDRALNCGDPRGSAKVNLRLRTQVQCVYRFGDYLYYATFMSSDTEESCTSVTSTLTLLGRAGANGRWQGNGRSGDWQDVTLSANGVNLTYYVDAGRMLCALVEGDERRPMSMDDIHQQWYRVIRPGS